MWRRKKEGAPEKGKEKEKEEKGRGCIFNRVFFSDEVSVLALKTWRQIATTNKAFGNFISEMIQSPGDIITEDDLRRGYNRATWSNVRLFFRLNLNFRLGVVVLTFL